MDANIYPEPASVSLAHCAQCGAPLRVGVANCDTCGLPVSIAAGTLPPPPAASEPAAPPTAHPDTAIPTATTISAPTTDQPPLAQPPQPTGPVRLCNWCGVMNPVGAARCASCNATFPKPEQDDILTRASRERVRLAMQDIEEVDRRRSRSFFARLFR